MPGRDKRAWHPQGEAWGLIRTSGGAALRPWAERNGLPSGGTTAKPGSMRRFKGRFCSQAQQHGSRLAWVRGHRGRPHTCAVPVFPRFTVERDTSHFERVREAFSAAGESFLVVGGMDSRGRCTGHVTLAVRSVFEAQKLLSKIGSCTAQGQNMSLSTPVLAGRFACFRNCADVDQQ